MRNKFLEIFYKQFKLENMDFQLIVNNEQCMELIVFYDFCDVKIVEQTKQFQLYVKGKDSIWISMYWVAKYLNVNYKIISVESLSKDYEDLINSQIEYILDWMQKNMLAINTFFSKPNLQNNIKKLREFVEKKD